MKNITSIIKRILIPTSIIACINSCKNIEIIPGKVYSNKEVPTFSKNKERHILIEESSEDYILCVYKKNLFNKNYSKKIANLNEGDEILLKKYKIGNKDPEYRIIFE